MSDKREEAQEFDEDGKPIEYEEISEYGSEEDPTPGPSDPPSPPVPRPVTHSSFPTPVKASPKTPRSKPGSSVPGGVRTAIAVASPSTPAVATIPSNKNPFDSSFTWGKATFDQVEVIVPPMAGRNETTNAKTRETAPSSRFWKVPVEFSYNSFRSDTIRIDNVLIPYAPGATYGTTYAYAAFPPWLKERVHTACKSTRPTVADDPSLLSNKEQWWKSINFKHGAFGTMVRSGDSSDFVAKPLSTILAGTKNGVVVTLVITVSLKARTDERADLSPTDAGRIAIDVVRAYYVDIDVNMPGAPRIQRERKEATASAFKKDVASEGLLGKFGRLGL